MSKPSKSAQSGLRTLKREWSDASDAAASSSQPIDWPLTPPTSAPAVTKATNVSIANKRLESIRAALAASNSELKVTTTVVPQKRPSQESTSNAPTKKPRRLPPGYNDVAPTRSIAYKLNSENLPTGQRGNLNTTTGGGGGTKTQTMTVPAPVATNKPIQKVAKVFLSQEQTYILKLVQEGQSVFYTGSAGTGKSVLLREIIKTMRKVYAKSYDAVAITASTGIAACNIGGITIHSFAGIGLGIESADVLIDRIKKNRKASTRWLKTKVLIIDEVSMLDGDLFDKLAKIGSVLKKRPSEPFGGIQLIVTGDFFQLPPVTKGSSSVKFAFEAEKWNSTIKYTFNLTKVFRQKDQEFIDMLNEMRFGRLSQKSIKKFKSLSRTITYDDGLGPTELFPRREDVERSNSNRMRNLNSEEMSYTASEGGTLKGTDQGEKLLSNFMAPPQLLVRVDAQVMLIKNIDEQLVNGTMGRVTEFVDPTSVEIDESGFTGAPPAKKNSSGAVLRYPVVEFSLANGGKRTTIVTPETWKIELPSGEVQVSRTQFPLILAWAMSIHKSQGQTLDRVKVDLSRVFEKGQAYVALSRATSLDGLQVLNFDPIKVKAHDKVARWSETLKTIEDLS